MHWLSWTFALVIATPIKPFLNLGVAIPLSKGAGRSAYAELLARATGVIKVCKANFNRGINIFSIIQALFAKVNNYYIDNTHTTAIYYLTLGIEAKKWC